MSLVPNARDRAFNEGYEEGRRAGLEEAARVVERSPAIIQPDNLIDLVKTYRKIAAAIRALAAAKEGE